MRLKMEWDAFVYHLYLSGSSVHLQTKRRRLKDKSRAREIKKQRERSKEKERHLLLLTGHWLLWLWPGDVGNVQPAWKSEQRKERRRKEERCFVTYDSGDGRDEQSEWEKPTHVAGRFASTVVVWILMMTGRWTGSSSYGVVAGWWRTVKWRVRCRRTLESKTWMRADVVCIIRVNNLIHSLNWSSVQLKAIGHEVRMKWRGDVRWEERWCRCSHSWNRVSRERKGNRFCHSLHRGEEERARERTVNLTVGESGESQSDCNLPSHNLVTYF